MKNTPRNSWTCDRCGEQRDADDTAFPANYGSDFWCETCISSRIPEYDGDEVDADEIDDRT